MRAYVAAATSDAERADRVAAQLRAAGVQVTSKRWPRRGNEDPSTPLARELRLERAVQDLDELDRCQFFVLLLPSDRHVSAGAWVGLGRAITVGKFIVAAGSHPSVYLGLANEHHAEDASAIASIIEHAKLRAVDSDHAELPAPGTPVLVRVENYEEDDPADKTKPVVRTEVVAPNDRRRDDVVLGVHARRLKDTWVLSTLVNFDADNRTVTIATPDGAERVLLAQSIDVDWRLD